MLGGKTEVANLSLGVRKILKMSGVLKIIPEVNLEEKISKEEEVVNQ